VKTAVLSLVAIAAMVIPSSLSGQSSVLRKPRPFQELTFMNVSPPLWSALPVPNGPAFWTNSSPRLFGTNRAQVLQFLETNRPSAPLAPGVYETAPYTCIVVVPRHHLDDRMIIGGQAVGINAVVAPSMPMVKPELRFIPRGNRGQ